VTFSYLELVVGFAGVAARARGDSFVSESLFTQPVDSSGNCDRAATLQPHVAAQFHFSLKHSFLFFRLVNF
jgi:hypothetical protein